MLLPPASGGRKKHVTEMGVKTGLGTSVLNRVHAFAAGRGKDPVEETRSAA
jgi:hypothetical protein